MLIASEETVLKWLKENKYQHMTRVLPLHDSPEVDNNGDVTGRFQGDVGHEQCVPVTWDDGGLRPDHDSSFFITTKSAGRSLFAKLSA